MTIIERIAAIAARAESATAWLDDCLSVIARREAEVGAWTCINPKAHEQALANPLAGPLAGLPFGVKDIFDSHDLPTENGTLLEVGRRPKADAYVVAQLRRAGGVLVGKTVTTELASYTPGKSRNPHDLSRTPGGSSSGSAAAVAAGMVPLAVGSQTNGSVIRPAAYCGVVGYKPSFGLVGRGGMLSHSRWLDHVGLFAQRVEEIALVVSTLLTKDPRDLDNRPAPKGLGYPLQPLDCAPRLAWSPNLIGERADPAALALIAAYARSQGAVLLPLPKVLRKAMECHRQIMEADMARSLTGRFGTRVDQLSPRLQEIISRGLALDEGSYQRALAERNTLTAALDRKLRSVDAVITPATVGIAPQDLTTTGDPCFCTLWSLIGAPALSLPLLSLDGMPLGVQLVGARYRDDLLLRIGHHLQQTSSVTPSQEDDIKTHYSFDT